MSRRQFSDLSPEEQQRWINIAFLRFTAAGHTYAESADPDFVQNSKAQSGKQLWERLNRTWLERWSGGWFDMTWDDHKVMFKNNYIGHRNSQTYLFGPKFYIPPRRGPWLRFLRWLQVVPPKPLTVKDVADIISQKPWNEGK